MPTFHRVLCPVDLSEASAHAVRYAHRLARVEAADLLVQHVQLPLFVAAPGLPEVAEALTAADTDALTADTRAFLQRAGLAEPSPAVVIDSGRPADEILARAVRERADLIVMGTHGASGIRHLMLGSVTEKVLRRAGCPVLTVPPGVADAAQDVPFRRILCAVDFSEWSMAALGLAATLGQATQASLLAVHAIEWPWPEPPAPDFDELPAQQAQALKEYRRYLTDRAHARLQAALAEAGGERGDLGVEVVHGKPHTELVRLAAERHADLIVLGVHGRSALDLTVFGSTTNQVVRHASCPVLTVRR